MCILKIYSDTTSFVPFIESTKMEVQACQFKGHLRNSYSDETYKFNRITFTASTKEWDDFKGQVLDVISFLTENEKELCSLIQSSDDIDAFLDFPLYSRLDGNIINQNDHLPKKLIMLAGRIGLGIEMAIYEKEAFDEISEK